MYLEIKLVTGREWPSEDKVNSNPEASKLAIIKKNCLKFKV